MGQPLPNVLRAASPHFPVSSLIAVLLIGGKVPIAYFTARVLYLLDFRGRCGCNAWVEYGTGLVFPD